ALATELDQPAHRILIELTFFGHRIFAGHKERRVHGPPAPDEIHKKPERVLIIKTATHRKEDLFAPTCPAKKSCRDQGQIKERSVIRDQNYRPSVIDGLDMLQAMNLYQVVSRDVNPAGAENRLAPRPEAFPAAQVHSMGNAKGKALEGRERCEFI